MKNTGIFKFYFFFFIVCVFFLLINIQAANFPFPQFRDYPYGIKITTFTENQIYNHLQETFLAWKNNYLTKSGAPKGTCRIQRGSANSFDTVSEGIGYGMLILVLTDNQTNTNRHYFDGLFRYYQCYLDQSGLMNWQIDRDGNIIGFNAATDADEDVALALVFAHYQWGSEGVINYIEEAKKIIDKIMKYQVEKPSYVLRPGDNFGGSDLTNPSYFSPAWWRIFKDITKDTNWDKVIDSCYSILDIFSKTQTGLVPDWCDAQGKEVSGYGYNYYYDACRVPWRIGLDYLWYGDERAYAVCSKIISWLISATQNNVNNIVSGYKLDGTPLVSYSNAAFVGPFGVGSMVSEEFQNYFNQLYNRLRNYSNGGPWGYYQDCLKLLTMLVMTGNFINFTKETPISTIPTCQIIEPFEDEVLSSTTTVKVFASAQSGIKKVELFYNNALIYETLVSSKEYMLSYNWDVSNFFNTTGTLKAVVYSVEDSSYSYIINTAVTPQQNLPQDGTGKVKILPNIVYKNNIYDFIISYTATADLNLAELCISFADCFETLLDSSQVQIGVGYGSPVVLSYQIKENNLVVKLLKISKGERIDLVLKNMTIKDTLGSFQFTVKVKNNGGVFKEIQENPVIKVYYSSEKNLDYKNNKKVITINNDYVNDVISFDSDEVSIYDFKGRKILDLKKTNMWDAKDINSKFLPVGVYFYRTKTGNKGIIYIVK